MEQNEIDGLVLSTVELNLLMRLLGCSEWADIPVVEANASLEQRMLEAFFHLAELGFLLPKEGGFVPAQDKLMPMGCFAEPDSVVLQIMADHPTVGFYQGTINCGILEQSGADREYCRLSVVPAEEYSAYLMERAEPLPENCGDKPYPTQILDWDSPLVQWISRSKIVYLVLDGNGEELGKICVTSAENALWLWDSKQKQCLPFTKAALKSQIMGMSVQ